MKKYHTIVSGGTFDHFHKGHEVFLLEQVKLSGKVLLGITSDEYIKKYKGEGIESYTIRVAAVRNFLKINHCLEQVEIEKIEDIYIPTVWENYHIEAIVVTADTKKGAEEINKKYILEGKSSLPVVVIPEVFAKDNKPISSSRIRNGEIDRDGNVFIHPEWLKKTIYLPNNLRVELKKPFGAVYSTIEELKQQIEIRGKFLISIGDVVTKMLQEENIYPNIAVVDLIVQRKPAHISLDEHKLSGYKIFSVTNPAGCITPNLFSAALESFHHKKSLIHILGEEDLAVLPFILAVSLGCLIFYGQPNAGFVVIEVTEAIKEKAKNLLEKFSFPASN